MNGFSGFAAAFCGVCAVFGAVRLIVPRGTLSKTVMYVLSLVFLSVLLTAALSAERFFPQIESKYAANGDNTAMSRAAIISVFETALTDGGINFDKIEVCTDKTADNSIIITEVTVYSSDSAPRIKELIGRADSYEVKVINE